MENAIQANAIQAIRADLEDNAAAFLRALQALVVYGGANGELLEKAKAFLAETLRDLGMDGMPENRRAGDLRPGISYAGMEAREAAMLDLDVFGEGRSIDQVQEHVFGMGFEKEREGQVRSSINAKANRDVYFKVTGAGEAVHLTPKGRESARRLKSRWNIQ